MEAQWIENLLMKGVIGSNSIEANARMCMTSAVTGYFHSYGSDTPPTSYDDIEDADFITFWGHNAREAHPVLFWRVADHKQAKDIPTLVSDPRRTGTVTGLEDINPRNSHHFATLNGDISYLNAIAHVILAKQPRGGHAGGVAGQALDGVARVRRGRQGALLAGAGRRAAPLHRRRARDRRGHREGREALRRGLGQGPRGAARAGS